MASGRNRAKASAVPQVRFYSQLQLTDENQGELILLVEFCTSLRLTGP